MQIKNISCFIKVVALTAVLITSAIVPQSVAHAQITDQDGDEVSAYVTSVELSTSKIAQGGFVNGTFTVQNGSSLPVDNISYNVSLTGDYEAGLPTVFYDNIQGEQTFDLAPQEIKTVPFTYKTPQHVAGAGLGVEIEIFLSTGASLGWNHAGLEITGQNSFIEVTEALVQKGDERYVLDFGPTFLENEQPQLRLVLENKGEESVSVVPRAVFSTYQDKDTDILEEKYEVKQLAANQSSTITLDLPTFERKAGVYYGNLYLEDEKGFAIGPKLPFQYIIDGDIATIHTVTFDQTELARGEGVTVSIKMSGKPFAPELVDGALESSLDGYTFKLVLKNEKQEVVATYEEELVHFNEADPKTVVLTVDKNTQYPLAEVTLEKGGKIIATYSSEIPDWVVVESSTILDTRLLILYGILLAALVSLGLIFAIRKDSKGIVLFFTLVIFALLAAVFLVMYTPLGARAEVAVVSFVQSNTGTGSCTNARGVSQGCGRVGSVWSLIPGVTINQPTVVNDNGSFNLTGNMTFDSCGNSSNSRHIWLVNADGSLTALGNQDTSAMSQSGFDSRGHWFTGNKRFSVPLAVGDACDVHTFNLRFVNCVAGECGFRQKQITLDLGPCDQCPNIGGNQREIPAGYRLDAATNQCLLTDDFQVLCSASPNPIIPGGQTTFTASAFNAEGDVNFNWYSGKNGTGIEIDGESTATRSRIRKTFDTQGMYQVSVRGEDESGATFTRNCGVMVRNLDADPNELVDTDGDGIPDTLVSDLLNALNSSVPQPNLSLEIDKVFTNDTCAITWIGQYVSQCYLVNGAGGSASVTTSGAGDVEPGTYWLRCLAQRDGSVAESEPVTCRLNPGIREI